MNIFVLRYGVCTEANRYACHVYGKHSRWPCDAMAERNAPTAANAETILNVPDGLSTQAHVSYLGGPDSRLMIVPAACRCTPCVSSDKKDIVIVQPRGAPAWIAHKECLVRVLQTADERRASCITVQMGKRRVKDLSSEELCAWGQLKRLPIANLILEQFRDKATVTFPISALNGVPHRMMRATPMSIQLKGSRATRLPCALPLAGFLTHWAYSVQTSVDRARPTWTVQAADVTRAEIGAMLRDTVSLAASTRHAPMHSRVSVWEWKRDNLFHRLVYVGIDASTSQYIQESAEKWEDGGSVHHWVDVNWPQWPGLTNVRRFLEQEADRYSDAPPSLLARETWRSSSVHVDLCGNLNIELAINNAMHNPRIVLVNGSPEHVRVDGRTILPCEMTTAELDAMVVAGTATVYPRVFDDGERRPALVVRDPPVASAVKRE